MTQRRELDRVANGVYLAPGAPFTYLARLWSTVLACDGILAFATAAHLWGTIDAVPAQVHVIVPHHRRVYPPQWIRVHRVHVPPRSQTTTSGLPLTSRPWSLIDHVTTLRLGDAARLVDRALQREWLTVRDIDRRLRDYPGRTGNGLLRRIRTGLVEGAAAESERRLHRVLRGARITGWKPNYPVWANGELLGVVDIAFPERRIAVEIDGWAYHSDVDRFRRDRSRQNALVAHGWTVLRFTWADLVDRPGYVVAMVRQMAA